MPCGKHIRSIMQLKMLLLLAALRPSSPLESPIQFQAGSPCPDLFLLRGHRDLLVNGMLYPVALPGHVSPVTSSEASEPVLNAFISETPAGSGDKRWESPYVGVNEVSEWVPPEDWQLPPPAIGLREQVPMDSEAGASGDQETSVPDSQEPNLFSSSAPTHQAFPHEASVGLPSRSEAPGVISSCVWKGPPLCNICKLKEASQATISSDGKHSEWDMFACRFCAPAVSLLHKTAMYKLRGRCTQCPRHATFAPPGYPQHVSLHCKTHKWAGEVSKKKRLEAALAGPSPPTSRGLDSGKHQQGSSTKCTSSWGDQASLLFDDSDSALQMLWSASERLSAGDSAPSGDKAGDSAYDDDATARGLPSRPPQHNAAPRHCRARGRSTSAGDVFLRRALEGSNVRRGGAGPSGRSKSCSSGVPLISDQSRGPTAACCEEGCTAVAAFGLDGGAHACSKHRRPDHKQLMPKRKGGLCGFAGGCAKRASFGDAELGVARFCADHKLSWHTNVRASRCAAAGCQVQASYGPPSSRKPVVCSRHRRPGDVDVRRSRLGAACHPGKARCLGSWVSTRAERDAGAHDGIGRQAVILTV